MPLSVIGAGFGRTGTDSLRHALNILGFGPCHHMFELKKDKALYARWQEIVKGGKPDWDAVFQGFNATVDWPSTHYWREISAHFPKAKIILTLRSTESWLASMEKTILPTIAKSKSLDTIGGLIVRDQLLGGDLTALDRAVAAYEQNTADVQAAFGPDRLLTLELGAGWEPLCDFLECPVPQVPYPRGNAPDEFHKSNPDDGT